MKILLVQSAQSTEKGSLEIETFLRDCDSRYQVVRAEAESLLRSPMLTDLSYAMVVLDCVVLNKHEMACVVKLSTLTENLPIVILANQIAIESYRCVDRIRNAVALQKPFKAELFKTLVEKACQGIGIKPEVCTRFITQQEVRLLVLHSGLIINSTMRNYSSSGVFLEYRGISLKVGDHVTVCVPNRDSVKPKEQLQFQARVVWLRDTEESTSPARGVGLQFI